MGPRRFSSRPALAGLILSALLGAFLGACASRSAPAPTAAEPTLTITPTRSLVDAPMDIRLAGLEPGERVTVRATMADSPELIWQASAVFAADAAGTVDLGRDAPLEGSYESADAMGLIWSMTPSTEDWEQHARAAPQLQPMRIRYEAERTGADKVFAAVDVERLRIAEDVRRSEVRAGGVVGNLYLPASASAQAPAPAVLVLGGSEGGLRESTAALLASHGFASFVVAYFAFDGLPPKLENIPLEYFDAALGAFAEQPGVDADHMAVLGVSRGGELALLLAASFPERLSAVVAYAASGVVWPGVGSLPPEPAWLRGDQPVPAVPFVADAAVQADVIQQMRSGEPVSLRNTFLASMKNPEAMAAGAIPVERISGPVLLISGEDDAIWPASELSELVVTRLRESGHTHAALHLRYPEAGHLILPPFRPSTARSARLATANMELAFGGTAAGTARASADSWPQVLDFLERALRP